MTPERRAELLASVARKRAAAQIVWPPDAKDAEDLREKIMLIGYCMTFTITYEEAQAMYEDGQIGAI